MKKILMTIAGVALALPACERKNVENEIRDLEEAKSNVGARVQELETELERAKDDVARLEEELSRSRKGLTDDVLKEREELQAALESQAENVEEEVAGAEERAEGHHAETQRALEALKGTEPGEGEAERQPVRGEDEAPARDETKPAPAEEREDVEEPEGVEEPGTFWDRLKPSISPEERSPDESPPDYGPKGP